MIVKLHLFLLIAISSCADNVTEMIEITELRRVHLLDAVGVVISTSSVLRCAANCNSSCVSLSYHDETNTCHIYDFLVSNDTLESKTENGWRSYRRNKGDCPTDIGYIYNSSLDWCYRLVTGLDYNIQGAESFCNLDGAHLVRINSMLRQLHMTDYLKSNGVASVYVGGRSENKDNNFFYDDETPLQFTFWDSDQPWQQTSIYIILVGNNYVWMNGHGTQPRDFVCEILV
ncbi:uncharacterized protein LOC132543461 [Ylistrum balloti]|uniref:uncharacterized protein LOC132543461 n=1 Tax=Ylistrum balloti TaxID=509963 RepID=UPI002905C941|nr:uncharacterized protein LOC132543461 [Ylistrum balloti]